MKKLFPILALVALLALTVFSVALAANPACKHTNRKWVTKTKGTCMTAGTEAYTCQAPSCRKVFSTRSTGKDPNNHVSSSIISWTTSTAPCYHRTGSEYRICSCGKTITRSIPKDPSYRPNFNKISDQTCESDEVWMAQCPVCRFREYDTRKYKTGHDMRNSNNNTWPYPELCETKTYQEWCVNPGCPKNKKKDVVIPGYGHFESTEWAPDGRPICGRCHKPFNP